MEAEKHYFLGYNIKWFYLEALYKIDENANWLSKFLLYFWRIVCCFAIISCVVGSCILIKNSLNQDFEKYAMNYMTVCIYTGCFARLVYCYACDQKSHDLVVKINSVFKYETRDEIEKYTVADYIKRAHNMTKVWIPYTILCVMFMNISPLLSIVTNERTLPINLWYPYDWRLSPFYELSFLHQVVSQFVMATTYGNTDVFFNCSSLLLAGQFHLLGFEFRKTFFNVLLQYGFSKQEVLLFKEYCIRCRKVDERQVGSPSDRKDSFVKIYYVINSEKFNEHLIARFKELVRFHQDLLSVCADVKSFFDPLQFSNFLFYVIYLTFMAFVQATTTNTSLMASSGEYLVAAFMQLFLITYFGQTLTSQSEKLLYDLYEFPWYMCSNKFKTMFRFAHFRSMKPIQLNVGKFGTISLNTYLLTLKTSFSYFTVLRQVSRQK